MPMYRIVGCILLVAAGTGMGFSGSMKLSERIYTLEMLLRMGIFLKGEIRCGNMSLPDAFTELPEEWMENTGNFS